MPGRPCNAAEAIAPWVFFVLSFLLHIFSFALAQEFVRLWEADGIAACALTREYSFLTRSENQLVTATAQAIQSYSLSDSQLLICISLSISFFLLVLSWASFPVRAYFSLRFWHFVFASFINRLQQ